MPLNRDYGFGLIQETENLARLQFHNYLSHFGHQYEF